MSPSRLSVVSRLQDARDSLTGVGASAPGSVDAGEVQEIISGAVYRVFSNMNHISTSMERAATGLRWASSNFEAHDSAIAEATARSLIGSEWQGTTADAFVSAAGRSVRDCDELGDMIISISSAITDYGYALASVQGKMANIRAQAADEGLTVSGTTISMPVNASDSDQSRLDSAYESASVQTTDALRSYTEAKSSLQSRLAAQGHGDDDRITAQDAGNIYTLFSNALQGGSNTLVGAASIMVGRSMVTEGERLLSQATRLSKAVMADLIARGGARLANEALNHADNMRLQAGNLLESADAKFKVNSPSFLANTGEALPVVGLVVGTGVDLANGESLSQAAASNTAATIAGVAAGELAETGATIIASAAMGAAGGSVVLGVGTAVGFAAGLIVGTGTAIFTDKAVDSMMEDHQGIGHAIEEGKDAVLSTGSNIANSVWKGAKGLFGGH